jgi:hypothetical protein
MSRSILRRKSICLFGLSADPPTGYGGHVGIVQALQQMDEWDEVWVLPVYRHTFSVRFVRWRVHFWCQHGIYILTLFP